MLRYEKELRKIESEVSEHLLTHMARELHDSVGQLHTAMSIQLEHIKLEQPEIVSSLPALESSLVDSTQQIRSLSRTLNRDYISRNGFINAIELELKRLRNLRKFEVHYSKNCTELPISPNEELFVFRIFQELSQNALRHSSANNYFVNLSCSPEGFTLRVWDDGTGTDIGSVLNSPRSSGLNNITARADMAGMSCRFESEPGKGFCCVLHKKKLNP
jgi:signal transduction histidine kinase